MIQVKEGRCSSCQKQTRLISDRCQACYWKYRSEVKRLEREKKGIEPKQKKNHTIAKFSSKRKAENVLYLKKRRIFMEQNKKCQAKLSGCSYWASDLHHKKTREFFLLDESVYMSVCRNCHDMIHLNDEESRKNGFLLSKF